MQFQLAIVNLIQNPKQIQMHTNTHLGGVICSFSKLLREANVTKGPKHRNEGSHYSTRRGIKCGRRCHFSGNDNGEWEYDGSHNGAH